MTVGRCITFVRHEELIRIVECMCWTGFFFIGSVLVAVFAGAVVCNGIICIYIYIYILCSRFQRKRRPMKSRENYLYAIFIYIYI